MKRISSSTLQFVLAAFLLVSLAYMSILNSDFILDDIPGILNNPNVGHPLQTNPSLFFRILMISLSFWVSGYSPIAYHVLNIIFHLATVYVLYVVVRRLSGKTAAWMSALLFAVHPILTESVTWISALTYPQYTFLLLLSFYAYINWDRGWRWRLLSGTSFLLAMLSSEKAIVLPGVLILYDLSFHSITTVKNHWKRIGVYVVLSAIAAGLLMVNVNARVQSFASDYLVKPELLNPFASIPTSMTNYLHLIFFPDSLSIYHADIVLPWWQTAFQIALTVLYFVLIAVAYRKNKTLFFWLSVFFISLTPTFLPWRIAWVVAERYVYFGTAALMACVGYLLSRLAKRPGYKTTAYGIAGLLIVALFVRTIMRNQDWQDQDSLWIATGKTAPDFHVTHNNLGDMYGRWGDPQRAIEEFTIATKIKPDYAEAYHNIGNTYVQLGNIQQAKKYFLLAKKYNPRIWQTHQQLAVIYFYEKNVAMAVSETKEAIKLSGSPALYEQLAQIYEQSGDAEAAAEARSRISSQ